MTKKEKLNNQWLIESYPKLKIDLEQDNKFCIIFEHTPDKKQIKEYEKINFDNMCRLNNFLVYKRAKFVAGKNQFKLLKKQLKQMRKIDFYIQQKYYCWRELIALKKKIFNVLKNKITILNQRFKCFYSGRQ